MLARTLAMLASCLASGASFAEQAQVVIDAEALLKERFSISAGRVSRLEECLPLGGGGGMRARKVPCEIFHTISNIQLDRVLSIKKGEPVFDDIDSALGADTYKLRNCWKDKELPFDESITFSTKESLSYDTSQTYTKVSESTYSFDVNASFFKLIGTKYGEELHQTVTHSMSSSEMFSKDLSVTLDRKTNIRVPPRTYYILEFSDAKKNISVPLEVSAVLKAEVHEETRALNGKVVQDRLIKTIGPDTDVGLRTVNVLGNVRYRASNRRLDLRTFEQKLADSDCAMPQ